MSAWTDVINAAVLQPWIAMAPGLLLAAMRWFGCLCWLPALSAAMTLRMKLAFSVILAIGVLPATGSSLTWLGSSGSTTTVALHVLAAAGGEFVLGSLLGLGVRITFAALQLAGELVDQQAGLALQQVFNPIADGETGSTASTLTWLGIAAFLVSEPVGGHLMLTEAMLQQFAAIPVGSATMEDLPRSLPLSLVEQSLELAVRVAGPLLAAMSLISTATAFLGRAAPQLPLGSIVAPVRTAVSLLLLAAAIPGTTELLSDQIQALAAINVRGTGGAWHRAR